MDYGREDGGEEEIQPRQIVAPEIGYKKPPPQTKGFAASTSEVTGENIRQIQRNVARAEAIGDDLLRLTGTSLDKGVELDALAKLPGQYRDGDEKVLPRCFEHGWNAGASIGSFSGCPGLLFRPRPNRGHLHRRNPAFLVLRRHQVLSKKMTVYV